jgi:hypothetical protein
MSDNGDVIGHHNLPPGFESEDMWVIKLDKFGNLLWNKCYGGQSFDEAVSISLTKNNGFIIEGTTHSNDGDVFGNTGMDMIVG